MLAYMLYADVEILRMRLILCFIRLVTRVQILFLQQHHHFVCRSWS